MKVHELITLLNKKPAGADVVIAKFNSRTEECEYFELIEVSGGDVDETAVIQNVYLDQGKKQ